MAADTRERTRAERAGDADPRICLWLKNEAGRRGVPQLRSFERWLAPIATLHAFDDWVEINILIVGEEAGRRFNRDFRSRDCATNVLSFAYDQEPGVHSGLLGDIVICAPVVAREALEQRKPLRDHYAHLSVHGVLHLLGYDHETDADAERMETLERKVLAAVGIADPYRVRD